MKKIDIKGKDYVQVDERVMEFHYQYKNGQIYLDDLRPSRMFLNLNKRPND